MKTRYYFLAFLCIATVMTLCACQQLNKSFEETLNPKPEKKDGSGSYTETHHSGSTNLQQTGPDEQENAKSIFEDGAALDRIQEALVNLPQFRGKKLMLYQSLYFYDFQGGRITVNIQNPDTTENVDSYVYAGGKWQEPTPVKIVGEMANEVDFLMPLDELKFSTAKKINDIAKEKIHEIQGGHTNGFLYFNYMRIKRINRTEAGWYLQIQGSRRDARLDFDVQGNLKAKK